MQTDAPKNVLILKPSALGDLVQGLPLVATLKRNFPDVRITWLVRPEFAPLLEGHPQIDELLIFDRRKLGRALKSFDAMRALVRFLGDIKRSGFDTTFDLQGLFRSAWFGFHSGAKHRFGMEESREFAHLFYTRRFKPSDGSVHLVDCYMRMAEAAGATDLEVTFELPEQQQAIADIEALLGEYDLQPNKFAVLVPGSAHADKCWPAENFARLAERIVQRFDLPIAAIGTEGERPIVEKMIALANVPIKNLAGKTKVMHLTPLLRRAELVISNDTGPGHIAAAVNTPTVMIFGPSNPDRVYPYGKEGSVAAADAFERAPTIRNPEEKYSIERVEVDVVMGKIADVFGGES